MDEVKYFLSSQITLKCTPSVCGAGEEGNKTALRYGQLSIVGKCHDLFLVTFIIESGQGPRFGGHKNE